MWLLWQISTIAWHYLLHTSKAGHLSLSLERLRCEELGVHSRASTCLQATDRAYRRDFPFGFGMKLRILIQE